MNAEDKKILHLLYKKLVNVEKIVIEHDETLNVLTDIVVDSKKKKR